MVTKKKIFVWNALGNALNVTASVLFLIAVTRLAGRTQSDAFNLGWSVSFLMQTIGSFSVRMFQATDVKEHYSFRQYAVFRFITVAVMGAMSLVYIALNHHSFEETTIILLLCSYKAIDAISDLFQGRFHQK